MQSQGYHAFVRVTEDGKEEKAILEIKGLSCCAIFISKGVAIAWGLSLTGGKAVISSVLIAALDGIGWMRYRLVKTQGSWTLIPYTNG